jgi:hypothetical protein
MEGVSNREGTDFIKKKKGRNREENRAGGRSSCCIDVQFFFRK